MSIPLHRSKFILPLVTALGSFAVCLAALRDGIGLNSDGWVYWEGSVSLLHGLGYRLFLHSAPITSWPPLFSVYLAGFQAALGVTGRTLTIAMSVANALAAYLWARLFVQIASQDGEIRPVQWGRLWLTCIFLIAFIGPRFRLLLADDLALVLLPGALSSAIFFGRQPSARLSSLAKQSTAVCLWLFLCLACKNSALAWTVGAAALVTQLRWQRPGTGRAAILGSIVLAVPTVGWLGLRVWAGQQNSHPAKIGGAAYSFLEYSLQALDSLAGMIGPRRFLAMGPFLLAAVLAGTVVSISWPGRERPELRKILRALLAFLAISISATGCLLALTGIPDELAGRFIWFAPLILVCSAITAWSMVPLPQVFDRTVTGLIVLIVGLAVFYSARSFRWDQSPTPFQKVEGTFVRNEWSIEPGFLERQPERRGAVLVVSPRVLPWEGRR